MVKTKIEGISLKSLEDLNIGQIRKSDKQFKKQKMKVPNIKLVKSYGKETKL